MAIYAGERVRIYSEALNWDNEPLGPGEVESCTVTIYDATSTVAETGAMQWLEDEARWLYPWDTAVAGSYTVEVVFSTLDGDSIETRHVVLDSPRPVPVVTSPLWVRT